MNQYRIGNIVQFSEINEARRLQKPPYDPAIRLAKVSEIYPDMLEVVDIDGNRVELKEAQPVELTYTILLDCGFVKEEKHYYKTLPGNTGLLVYATVTKDNPVGLYLGKAPFSDKSPLQLLYHRLTSLHELMNLYFAMTREELVWEKFKPTVEELLPLKETNFTKSKMDFPYQGSSDT